MGMARMNKLMFEHYPASKLPADLREGLDKGATVRIVIEEEPKQAQAQEAGSFPGFQELPSIVRQPMSIEDTLAAIKRIKAQDRPSVSSEEAVARVRVLRDEWDD